MSQYHHILFASDLNTDTLLVAKRAKRIANDMNARLSLIHIVEPLPIYAYGYIDSAGIEQQHLEEARTALENTAKTLNLEPAKCYLREGYPKSEIVKFAEEEGVDLIIVGSHIKNLFAGLLGSTADAVSHAAHCDVLIVRIKERAHS